MIRVTVELLPGGREERKETLGVARIWNTGKGSSTQGQYKFELYGKKNAFLTSGSLKNFPRKRLLGWDLVRWMLNIARDPKQNVFEGTIDGSMGDQLVRLLPPDCL